ncbi:MAG: hypothetical protein V2J10_08510 [Wenzhouxiangella sp.]|jgi:hypothetical protein|nr:hypothetical protein [Wenzhouxiangella sp.]
MQARTYDIQGFTLCLDKVVLLSSVFEAENAEGWQFNIRLLGDVRVKVKRPDRPAALLERQMLVRALNGLPVEDPDDSS